MFVDSGNGRIKHSFSAWKEFKQKIIRFCKSTNLHGFRYIVDTNVSIFARLFFAIACGCSLVLGTYLIVLQIFEYHNGFIITRIVSTNYPVWQLRFPSVIMCNHNVVYKDHLKPIKDIVMSDNMVKPELFNDFIYNLPSLINCTINHNNSKDYTMIYKRLEKKGYNIDKVMAQLAHPCNGMVKKCLWKGEDISCQHIIHSVKTNQGYCCSFNYYGTRSNVKTMEDPYNLKYTYSTLSDPIFGLRLLLDVEIDQYVSSIKRFHGLNILVQDGGDYPNMYLSSSTLQMSEELRVSLRPDVYASTPNLRNIHPQRRGCLFENESKLKWSSIYSYKTCVNQCKASAIYKFCNCTPFFYPLERFRRLCSFSDVPCLDRYRYNYTAVLVDEDTFTDIEAREINPHIREFINCTCYPQCNEMMYHIDTHRAKQTLSKKNPWYLNPNLSVLNIYYNDLDCTKIERDVYYTWDRILAAVGGIFSLCLGGSIISVVECFYFIGKFITNPEMNNGEKVNLQKHSPRTNNNVQNNFLKKKKNHIQAQRFIKAFGNQ